LVQLNAGFRQAIIFAYETGMNRPCIARHADGAADRATPSAAS
jgi:hypothetical protein